jgi:hypothetical protein
MNELASHSTLAHITNVTIERHECVTVGGEEDGHCDVTVVHGGIPHGGTCPPAGGAHGGDQYPWPEGGRGVLELWSRCQAGGGGVQYLAGGGGGDHIEVCPAAGDPPHDITGVGTI